jgi:hypothetical protein
MTSCGSIKRSIFGGFRIEQKKQNDLMSNVSSLLESMLQSLYDSCTVKINDKNVLQSFIRYKITILAAKIWNCKDVGKKCSNLGSYYNATIVGCFITSTSYSSFDTSLNIIVNEAYSSKIKKKKSKYLFAKLSKHGS